MITLEEIKAMKRGDKFYHKGWGDSVTAVIADVSKDRIYFDLVYTKTGFPVDLDGGVQWDSYTGARNNMYVLDPLDETTNWEGIT